MKLNNLQINEESLRNLYLKKLSLGEIQGPQLGKASIDKPWLKYYINLIMLIMSLPFILKMTNKYMMLISTMILTFSLSDLILNFDNYCK